MILFVNACVKSGSRTKRIADAVLSGFDEEIVEERLIDIDFPKTDEEFLKFRDDCIAREDFSDSYFDLAKRFAAADTIIMAAPYWDLSFPASLKQYIEHINVLEITFKYSDQGYPEPMCRAKKLIYIMTAGGSLVPEEFGFGYIKSVAQNFYGIKEVELIKAAGLDIVGADVDGIVNEVIGSL